MVIRLVTKNETSKKYKKLPLSRANNDENDDVISVMRMMVTIQRTRVGIIVCPNMTSLCVKPSPVRAF